MSCLVFDIESIPDERVWTRPEPDSDEGTFPPFYAHIPIVIGCVELEDDYQPVKIGAIRFDPAGLAAAGLASEEANLLAAFSSYCEKKRPVLVSWYGRGFDMPVIQARALAHGVSMSWYHGASSRRGLYRYRYSDEGHSDLCDQLSEYGAVRGAKLDAFAKLIGCPGKHGVDGSQVEGMWKKGRYEEIVSYCMSDAVQTAFVFLRWRFIENHMEKASYNRAAQKLHDMCLAEKRTADLGDKIDIERILL